MNLPESIPGICVPRSLPAETATLTILNSPCHAGAAECLHLKCRYGKFPSFVMCTLAHLLLGRTVRVIDLSGSARFMLAKCYDPPSLQSVLRRFPSHTVSLQGKTRLSRFTDARSNAIIAHSTDYLSNFSTVFLDPLPRLCQIETPNGKEDWTTRFSP